MGAYIVTFKLKLTTDQVEEDKIKEGMLELLQIPRASCGCNKALGRFLLMAENTREEDYRCMTLQLDPNGGG